MHAVSTGLLLDIIGIQTVQTWGKQTDSKVVLGRGLCRNLCLHACTQNPVRMSKACVKLCSALGKYRANKLYVNHTFAAMYGAE